MRALVFDGYTDEPACLGVPPYLSPNVRLAYGALRAAGADISYATVDQWRSGSVELHSYDLVAVVRNIAVPGRYLRGMPASDKELMAISAQSKGIIAASLGVNPNRIRTEVRQAFDHVSSLDFDASLHDLAVEKDFVQRRRSEREWNDWLLRGAEVCRMHPDHGGPLIAEVQMYRGCVRYVSGGCRFCTEPVYGGVSFRQPKDILTEVDALSKNGVRNFRLGAQSCVYCYMSDDVGESETPRPNPGAMLKLLKGIREAVNPDVFHLDNANPAVIAENPKESEEITRMIAEYCTSGNVLAFGLESADPEVARANNLNTTPEQTMKAIRMVNAVGSQRGPTGLPLVLPGINFVCGLYGETKRTYDLNLQFLKSVAGERLLLRRINIRQVIPSRDEFPGIVSKEAFAKFKRAVREEIDAPMLERLVPDGTMLSSVYAEVREGGRTFGRQVGTYPLLVSIPYPVEVGERFDVAVTGRGFRSITGIVSPTDVNSASLSMLRAVPGVGKMVAMAIMRKRPFHQLEKLWELFEDKTALERARPHLAIGDVDR